MAPCPAESDVVELGKRWPSYRQFGDELGRVFDVCLTAKLRVFDVCLTAKFVWQPPVLTLPQAYVDVDEYAYANCMWRMRRTQ